jgi:FkbM family methyltransferase
MIKRALRPLKRFLQSKFFACYLNHSYAQEGEDMILARVFEGHAQGFYVDVGAHHPTLFSNTYNFYLRGWRGVNIDAMPGSMSLFQKMRPRDINVERAVAEKPGKLIFHVFNSPALNTFDADLARQRDGVGEWKIIGVKEIETQPLAQILRDVVPQGQAIDFMSVDVEGLDLEVLRSNDWSLFSPTYVLAEDFFIGGVEEALKSPITEFLRSKGYALFAKTAHTLIFKKV